MRAARFHGPGQGLEIEDVPRPEIGASEVLVRIAGAGLCHSDLHILEGELPLPHLPRTLGHENAGYVEEVGEEVDDVEPGTPVAVFGGWGCGRCEFCMRGREQLCDITSWVGIGHDGGFAEYLRLPTSRYLVELDSVEPVAAAPLTDAGLTAYRAVQRARDELQPRDAIAVIGIGGLGQYAIQFANMATGGRVIGVDVDDRKLDRATSLGADVTVDSSREAVQPAIRAATDGRGVGAVLDFVGTDGTLRTGDDILRTGGILLLAGIAEGELGLGWDPLAPAERTYTTVRWGSLDELAEVIGLAEQGRVESRTETVGFDELPATFDRMAAGEIDGRAVLTP